jgi:hypothetical protein
VAKKNEPFGSLDGEKVEALDLRFAGVMDADRLIEHGDQVFIVARCTASWTKFNSSEKRGLVRQQNLVVNSVIELPEELREEIEARIREVEGAPNLDDALADMESEVDPETGDPF